MLMIMVGLSINISAAQPKEETDDENVKEEIVSTSPEGTLIKRTISQPKEQPLKSIQSNGKAQKNICTKYFAKWPVTPVNYYFSPVNTQGLDWVQLTDAIDTSAKTWDSETTTTLVNTVNIDSTAVFGVQDYKNSIVFGDNVLNTGVIAQTIIWYYAGYGTIPGKIVEFDMTFEDNFPWGFGDVTKMDVQNIGTHEFGHAYGLSDLYNSACSTQTMYGYSGIGEFSKRTLEFGDIRGIRTLYH